MGSPAQHRIFNANIESVSKPPDIGKVLDAHTPHLAVITEAYHARAHLEQVAEHHGYRLKQYGAEKGAEAPDIAVLVRNNVTIAKRDPMTMKQPWWGPNTGKRREPRVYVKLLLEDSRLPGDLNWKYVCVHFPPGGPTGGTSAKLHGKNQSAWHESRDRVVKYGNEHPDGPYVIVGDINATHDECRAQIAQRLDGTVHTADLGKVDHAIIRKSADCATHKLKSPVGHGWGIVHVTAQNKP